MRRLSSQSQKFRLLGLGLLGLVLAFAIALTPLPAPAAPPPATTLETRASVDPLSAGRVYYTSGQFAAAIEQWQTAAQIADQQGDLASQVMSWNGIASAHQALSQWAQANQSIEQSQTLLNNASAPEPILWAQTLNTQASLLLNHTGQAEAALETWQQAEHYYQEAGDLLGTLGVQINQAQALQTLGFYRRARHQLEALDQQLISMPDSDIKVAALRSLGQTLQLIGVPRDSYDALAQSLETARNIGATSDVSSIYLSIAKLAFKLDSPAQALEYFQAAEASALMPLDQLQARLGKLASYINMGDIKSISGVTASIQQQLNTLPPSRTTVYGTINLAHSLARLPHSQRPISNQTINQLLADALQAAKSLGDQRAEAYTLSQLGQLYHQNHQESAALTLSQKSLTLAESIQSPDIISQSAWQLGKLFKQQQQQESAVEAYTKAVTALQSLRGDLVAINQDIQFSYREEVEPVYRELVALLLAENSQASLRQARDVLEDLQVAELDNFFQEACLDLESNPIDQLDAKATVVYSIILDGQLSVIYSQPDQPLQAYATEVDQATLETTLRSFLASLHPSADRPQQLTYSQTLYDWIIRPAEEAGILHSDQTLVFVLDGLLRNLPMAALHDGEQYLIEKYAIALSPGLQLLPASVFSQQDTRAIVAGISESRGRFSALPAVQEEVTTISQLLPSLRLLNHKFTKQSLRQSLSDRRVNVVHLATHGRFSSEFSQTFFLTWDGVVNINELSELLKRRQTDSSRPIELLTLSACETATGDDRAALGLAGLAVRSGARSTLATLWAVKDEVAKQLMTTVYENLGQASLTKAEALRQAQLELLHSDDFADPFFWAAYVLIGNWL
ncbi:CHAT domain-containing protein [Leptothoe spongobia]|uniref:CHAT domain-containing protein n=1 Tax=Leptothoe spongobia TAU-MAC 1115 TaxID=1967444 RepID=A0A947GJH0_9CYAN|nr:CHAT domain-containing protein [Leptothoe spongobia]MBT9315642.1 CHAT domain-containing protein [Leptothoe spongobia TAU-MAC 1115]